MSWRSQATVTGTNDTPLLNRRRFGPTLDEANGSDYVGIKRGREDEKSSTPDPSADPNAPRKRRSRFGEAKAAEVPGLPAAVSSAGVSLKDLDNYAISMRLEEINRKLRLNDVVPPERERSPSPPPTYDSHGRRTNTRDIRYRKKLEEERVRLVERAMKNDPNFQPPAEYHQQKRSHRPQDKVYIPVKEFPEINFFGLLVGPRGNSLKKMERESGAKISIRGKGSVKEGKGRPEAYADDAEEDLHCLVMAETQDKVEACVSMINRVIETAASTPEGQNDHKRNQLRELAALNGTLRDDENQICQNCGNRGHRKYDCPEQKNFSANIICRICGSAGHMARDCTSGKTDPNGFVNPAVNGAGTPGVTPSGGFDSEYAKLMAELGEDGASSMQGGGTSGLIGGSKVPPWRLPESWIQNNPRPQQGFSQGGYYPQQAYGNYAGGYQASYPQPGFDQQAAYAQYYQNLQQQH